MIDYIVTPHSG